MKKTATLLTLTLLFATSAFAKPNARVVEVDEAVVVRGTSEHMRQDKQYLMDAILLGVGPSLVSTTGLELGKYLDRDSLAILQFTTGSNGWGAGDLGSSYEIKATSVGAHYKQFSGNSFYWRGGVDYRMAELNYKYVSSTPANSVTRSFKGNSFALNFQIGNQWQWENFTLGCDWIGYTLPVASNISEENVSSNDLTYDQRRNKEDQDLLTKNGHINLLRFYLGASF